MSSTSNPSKGRLVSHFEDRPTPSHGQAWSDLWDSGDSGLWDRGIPSPALIDLIEGYHETILCPFYPNQEGNGDGLRLKRKKALVPGCGRGYDAIALSLHGFDAYGLEISSTAIEEARKFAETQMVSPQPCNFGHSSLQRLSADGGGIGLDPGHVQFVQGDFFESGSVEEVKEGEYWEGEGFDLVYDYTFLCALHPSQRGKWAERMAELIKPGGKLVCLEFPMYKDPKLPGPPWGVNGVHWELLAGGDGGNGMFTRRVYYKPERTYEVGKGTDMISVYERK